MGSLLIVTGPPGAGKSTVSRMVADRSDLTALIEGDAFFRFLHQGAIAPWLPESRQQNETVTQAAAAAAGLYAAGGYTTVYDGVVGPWALDAFAAATGLSHLHYVVLLPPIEVCVERVSTRRNHGFNNEPATRHMWTEFANTEIDERHVLRQPPAIAEEVADLIEALTAVDTFLHRA